MTARHANAKQAFCDRVVYMTVVIELPADLEARLEFAARERGIGLESYIRTVLDESSPVPLPSARDISAEEFHSALEQMAQFADRIPISADETFPREMICQDHD
jgi:hypothetical protein